METKLSTHRLDALFLRDKNLVHEVIGKMSFTEAMFYHIIGAPPTRGQTSVLDAVLVTLMEHGLTPSAISTRLTYLSWLYVTPKLPLACSKRLLNWLLYMVHPRVVTNSGLN